MWIHNRYLWGYIVASAVLAWGLPLGHARVPRLAPPVRVVLSCCRTAVVIENNRCQVASFH